MTSDAQIELRVSRLENDRDSIYDLLSEVRSTQDQHSRRFDAVDQRFDAVDQRFDAVDQRLEGMDHRLGSIGTTLVEVLRRLPEPA